MTTVRPNLKLKKKTNKILVISSATHSIHLYFIWIKKSQTAVRQRQETGQTTEESRLLSEGDTAVQLLDPGHYRVVFGKDEQLVFFINRMLEFVIRHISGTPYFN